MLLEKAWQSKPLEYRKIASNLPNPTEVIHGKVKKLDSKIAEEISAKYSLVVSIAYELNDIRKDTGVDEKSQQDA